MADEKKDVRPVPEGLHTATVFLNVDGAANAIEWYKKAFDAKERARMPMPGGKIMHAEILIGDSVIMLSDAQKEPASRSEIMLYVEDCDAWFKRAISAGAKVIVQPQDMFWGDRYARISDPFGQKWQIATHKEDVSLLELEQRAAAARSAMNVFDDF